LERIIRAEIDLVAVKNIVTNIEEKTEKVKNENNDELSRLAEKMDILQDKMNNLVRNVSTNLILLIDYKIYQKMFFSSFIIIFIILLIFLLLLKWK
jgi:hypothetical protein